MVRLLVKQNDTILFQIETTQDSLVEKMLQNICYLHNGKLKIWRICEEVCQLSQFGPINCSEIKEGLYEPDGGSTKNKDPTGKRCGQMPNEKMKNILVDTIDKAKKIISDDLHKGGISLIQDHIQEALDILSGAVSIVYPKGLPPKDPIQLELTNNEEIDETEETKQIFVPSKMELWFAAKEMQLNKKLYNYFGTNEKTKVIVKVQQKGSGQPTREPIISEEEKRKLAMDEYRRREQIKKLNADLDNSYLNSAWADNTSLKKSFHGLNDVTWKPK